MAKPTIEDAARSVPGQVITRDDPDYEAARKVYNAMIDRRPQVVVRAVDAADVMAAVHFARENGLDLSIRGGSHSVPGFGTNDDGVVIDLVADEGDPRGPGGADRASRGRLHLGRPLPRHLRVRARHDRRHHLDDGNRRPHAGRRHRPPVARARALHRQPAVGRRRHGRRTASGSRARRRTRTSSGRSGAVAATSASSPRSSTGCTP